jgi:hypothetical protein
MEEVWIGELDLLTTWYTPLGSTSNYSVITYLLSGEYPATEISHSPAGL